MRRLHLSRANIQRRTSKVIDPQQLKPNRRAHDVHNRIDSAHFVEMHFFHRHVVDFRFRLPPAA